MTDNLTGLMWSKDANLTGDMTWNEALIFSNNLTLCGYSDWRLPNLKEHRCIIAANTNQKDGNAGEDDNTLMPGIQLLFQKRK